MLKKEVKKLRLTIDTKKGSESGESTIIVQFDKNYTMCTFKHTPLRLNDV